MRPVVGGRTALEILELKVLELTGHCNNSFGVFVKIGHF